MIRPFAGKLALAAGVAIAIPFLASPATAGDAAAPIIVPDSAIHAMSTTVGGAEPQPSTNTLTHFFPPRSTRSTPPPSVSTWWDRIPRS